eukprot:COSAG06_NODE_9355_length_1921_cov_146.652580_1_plen_32_part_10
MIFTLNILAPLGHVHTDSIVHASGHVSTWAVT